MQLIASCYLWLLIVESMVFCKMQLKVKILQKQSSKILHYLNSIKSSNTNSFSMCVPHDHRHQDCGEIYNAGHQESGIYFLHFFQGQNLLPVYCDMTAVGERSGKKGWISIQRRQDGTVSFDRGWQDYVNGFGFPNGEHWIGLQNIFDIVWKAEKKCSKSNFPRLQIEMEDWDAMSIYFEHHSIAIEPEGNDYQLCRLGISNKSYNLNSFLLQLTTPFSTYDYNPDGRSKDCMREQRGGWWFGNCWHSNLNGLYPARGAKNSYRFMYVDGWYKINPNNAALRRVSMMLH